MNHAANLRKEMDAIFDEYLRETTAALLARFLMEKSPNRGALTSGRPRALIEAEAGPA